MPPEASQSSDGAGSLHSTRMPARIFALAAFLAYAPPILRDHATADFDTIVFRPGALPVLGVIAISGLVCWGRLGRLRELSSAGALGVAMSFATLGAALYLWATRLGETTLLLAALGLHGLALGALANGWSGARVMAVPALILALGIPFPKPIEDAVLWFLQRSTAESATWLLTSLGLPFSHRGVMIHGVDHTFHVIDGCSGLSGIVILVLAALGVRELLELRRRRSWALVALAVPLGFALNVLRIAYVAASPDPEALAGQDGDHTAQGLIVLMVGSVVLYAVGRALAGSPAAPSRRGAGPSGISRAGWLSAAAGLASLALLDGLLPRFDEGKALAYPGISKIPMQHAGWVGEAMDSDFEGVLVGMHRQYRLHPGPGRPAQIVELMLGFEHPTNLESFRLLCAKLSFPGPDWELLSRGTERIWELNRDGKLSRFQREERQALSYAWFVNDGGLWRESLRSWLALEASPFRRSTPRGGIRLVAYAPYEGQLALDRSRQRLDRFVSDFREFLGNPLQDPRPDPP